MEHTSARFDRAGGIFETVVIYVVQVLLMIVIALTVGMLIWLLLSQGIARMRSVETLPELQPLVLRTLAGSLLVLLGLELLESLRTFFVEHHTRLEMILIVAAIAVGRHVILLDFEHASGLSLLGVASLVLALTAGYYLVKRSQHPAP
jgi:uncharacterized membrane protein (DUF373 family)